MRTAAFRAAQDVTHGTRTCKPVSATANESQPACLSHTDGWTTLNRSLSASLRAVQLTPSHTHGVPAPVELSTCVSEDLVRWIFLCAPQAAQISPLASARCAVIRLHAQVTPSRRQVQNLPPVAVRCVLPRSRSPSCVLVLPSFCSFSLRPDMPQRRKRSKWGCQGNAHGRTCQPRQGFTVIDQGDSSGSAKAVGAPGGVGTGARGSERRAPCFR